ncbi:MAG: hypothetical protein EOM51_05450 [Clostridia bacterium]|nr:hypothetical protein [Clostridia bacterium]
MTVIDMIAAFALSLTFLLLTWTIKGYLLRPNLSKSSKVTIVLTADGDTKNLESEIAGLCWLKDDRRLIADILIVDMGMNAETVKIANCLLQKNSSLRICTPEEIANIVTRGMGNGAKG